MVDQNQRITPPRFNLGTGAGTSGDTGLGHGVGFTDRWLGLGYGVGLTDRVAGNQTFRA